MTKDLNDQVREFRGRSLAGSRYPVLWTDALYEKIRVDGRVISMAVLIVCGVNEQGHREVPAVEPMLEEPKESYSQLFGNLQQRGLETPSLVISDANKGLIAAIRESFPGASWQRCKVHFMRNILAHVPQKEKETFAAQLKEIWLAPSAELAGQRAKQLAEQYRESGSPRRLSFWRMDWRILWLFMRLRIWTPAKLLPPTCWNG